MRLPLIQVRLSANEKAFKTIALVDSGATASFIPRYATEVLELNQLNLLDLLGPGVRNADYEKDEIVVVGAGGSFRTYLVKIEKISLMKGQQIFAEFEECVVHVPAGSAEIPYMVLGRDSVFKEFNITFQEKKEKIVMRRSF